MHVRATTVLAPPTQVDAAISLARDLVRPAVERLPDSLGSSLFVDRETGQLTLSCAWRTEDAREAAAADLTPLMWQWADAAGGEATHELFDLAVLDRRRPAEDGFWARLTRLSMDPAGLDEGIDVYGSTTLPQLQLLDGFCSAALLVNHATGAGVSSVVFDSRAALEASRDGSAAIRAATADKVGATITEVREAQVVLAGMRMPQTG